MKKSIFKILVKDGLGFNLKDTLETFDQLMIIFLGAFLGGIVSISLYKNQINILIGIIILILIFSIISTILRIIQSIIIN